MSRAQRYVVGVLREASIFERWPKTIMGGVWLMMVFGRSARKQACVGEEIIFDKRGHQSRETRERRSGGKSKDQQPAEQLHFTAL
jgi:hypothetical protein